MRPRYSSGESRCPSDAVMSLAPAPPVHVLCSGHSQRTAGNEGTDSILPIYREADSNVADACSDALRHEIELDQAVHRQRDCAVCLVLIRCRNSAACSLLSLASAWSCM